MTTVTTNILTAGLPPKSDPGLQKVFRVVIDLVRNDNDAGAEEGLNRARKIPNFDLDWRGLPPTDRNWLRFTQARDRILDISERNPLATLVTPSGSSSGSRGNTGAMSTSGRCTMPSRRSITRVASALDSPPQA